MRNIALSITRGLPRFGDQEKALITQVLAATPNRLPQTGGETYGAICAALEGAGQVIGNNDLWIAAHAKVEALTLVTSPP